MLDGSSVIPIGIPCTPADFAGLTSDLLWAGKGLRFRARGGSMQPLIRDGDLLFVRPVEGSAVKIGDVVLFHGRLDRVVVHRVIRVQVIPEGRRFTVQGDLLSRPDGLIHEAQVCGRVVAIERGMTTINLRRPVMRMLGWAATARSRWGVGRGGQLRWVKRLPLLDRYLA